MTVKIRARLPRPDNFLQIQTLRIDSRAVVPGSDSGDFPLEPELFEKPAAPMQQEARECSSHVAESKQCQIDLSCVASNHHPARIVLGLRSWMITCTCSSARLRCSGGVP